MIFNETDRIILRFIWDKPKTIAAIQRHIPIAYKNLNPHIKKLGDANIIIVKDNGRGKPKEISIDKNDSDIVGFAKVMGIIKKEKPKTDWHGFIRSHQECLLQKK